MRIFGVDPGKAGGIAGMQSDHAQSLELLVMPEDLREWADALDVICDQHVFIEKAQSFPGQGISSAFNYGRHFGELLGILIAHKIPHTLVAPATWTRVMHKGCSGADAKRKSLEAARRIFPSHDFRATPRCKREHDGLVDASLILEYGRRLLAGGA